MLDAKSTTVSIAWTDRGGEFVAFVPDLTPDYPLCEELIPALHPTTAVAKTGAECGAVNGQGPKYVQTGDC
jgi:hypothetical protein